MKQTAPQRFLLPTDNRMIKGMRLEPETPPSGVIQILHGFGEHAHFYAEFASFFAANGFACVVHDHRGFGELYVHERGAVERYADLVADTGAVYAAIAEWYSGLPVYLYGHSMGGNVALSYLYDKGHHRYKKLVLESPWLRKYQARRYEALEPFARLIGALDYRWKVRYRLRPGDITSAVQKHDLLQGDPYYHNDIGFRLFSDVTRAGKRALREPERLQIPTLLLCGEKDRIVSPRAMRDFHRKTGPHVLLRRYPNGRHTLHHDSVKQEVYADMLDFLVR